MTANPPDAFDPNDRLLPWRKVKDLTGISRTTAWRLQNAGDFPRPVVISRGRVGWRESDVAAWKAALTPRHAASRPAQPRLFAAEPDPNIAATTPSGPGAPDERLRKQGSRPRRRRSPTPKDQLSFDF